MARYCFIPFAPNDFESYEALFCIFKFTHFTFWSTGTWIGITRFYSVTIKVRLSVPFRTVMSLCHSYSMSKPIEVDGFIYCDFFRFLRNFHWHFLNRFLWWFHWCIYYYRRCFLCRCSKKIISYRYSCESIGFLSKYYLS